MHKRSGGGAPRYFTLLKLTLAAAALRAVACLPFCLGYALPRGGWTWPLLLLSPLLWAVVVAPARVRYGRALAACARDKNARLQVRSLLSSNQPWLPVCLGRLRLAWGNALPFIVLSGLLLLPLWLAENVFGAVKTLLNIFIFIASAAATAVTAIPQLITNGAVSWTDAGVLGGVIAMGILLVFTLALFIGGAFQTGAYRFGLARRPKGSALRPLLLKNLLLWLPALLCFAAFIAVSYQELLLLGSNVLSAEAVFRVKPQPLQIALLALFAAAYLLPLPLRRWNTAVWAREHA